MKWVQHCPKCTGPNSSKPAKNYSKRPSRAKKATDITQPKPDPRHRISKPTQERVYDDEKVRRALEDLMSQADPSPSTQSSWSEPSAVPEEHSASGELLSSVEPVISEHPYPPEEVSFPPEDLEQSFGPEDLARAEQALWTEEFWLEEPLMMNEMSPTEGLFPMDDLFGTEMFPTPDEY